MDVWKEKFELDAGSQLPCSEVQHCFKSTDKADSRALGRWLKSAFHIESKLVKVDDPDRPGTKKPVNHYIGLALKAEAEESEEYYLIE